MRLVWIVLAVVGLFLFTYLLAWVNSYRLGEEFYTSAEQSYTEGRYLDALAGYEVIDPTTHQRVTHSGYYQVTKLWGDQGAFPKPEIYAHSLARIHEIIQEKLDISSAETFIQVYTGRNHPYFADVYLRLGELYEADGDKRSAIEIYRDCTTLFPDRADIVAAAQQKLDALGAKK